MSRLHHDGGKEIPLDNLLLLPIVPNSCLVIRGGVPTTSNETLPCVNVRHNCALIGHCWVSRSAERRRNAAQITCFLKQLLRMSRDGVYSRGWVSCGQIIREDLNLTRIVSRCRVSLQSKWWKRCTTKNKGLLHSTL
jgi:hypothetical protein